MNTELCDKLAGVLIGLARATEGNEDLMREETDLAILAGLRALAEDRTDDAIFSRIAEEKRALVPNCFYCASPCGRTSDFDMAMLRLEEADVQAAKRSILNDLRNAAKHISNDSSLTSDEKTFIRDALITIGRDVWDKERLFTFAAQAHAFYEKLARS